MTIQNIATSLKQHIKDPLHFIGVGGSGMAGLATIALQAGLKVQGSDQRKTPKIEELIKKGLHFFNHHDAQNSSGATTVVVSSAIAKDNAELLAAKGAGLRILHRSEFLKMLMDPFQAITVAGTHGKTTTAGMITHALLALDQNPSYAIGGTMMHINSSAQLNTGKYFVAEADESDGSFLKYKPFISVVTNIDQDHMDHYGNIESLEQAFVNHMNATDPKGCVVVGWDNATVRRLVPQVDRRRLSYGFFIGSDVRATQYTTHAGEVTFTAIVERDQVKCRLKALGRHNVANALCVLAVARALELDIKKTAESLSEFTGMARRMACHYQSQSLSIFDDYAHNPGKMAACLRALREGFPNRQLHVALQFHRYSRLETMFQDMINSVCEADYLYVLPVFHAGESTEGDFSPEKLCSEILKRGKVKQCFPCYTYQEALTSMEQHVAGPAVILTLGAGDVCDLIEPLKERFF